LAPDKLEVAVAGVSRDVLRGDEDGLPRGSGVGGTLKAGRRSGQQEVGAGDGAVLPIACGGCGSYFAPLWRSCLPSSLAVATGRGRVVV
jgi:hypothetical protein